MLIPLQQNQNNADTGWFLDSATDKVGFYVAGTKRLEFSDTGAAISTLPSLSALSPTLAALTVTGALSAASGAFTGLLTAGDVGFNDLKRADVTISAADLVDVTAGKFGHANGQEIVGAPGADKALELISCLVIYDYATAAYGDGGNVSANYAAGGPVLSGVVAAAQSAGAAGDKVALLLPVVPTNNQLVANAGINLVAAAAFTQPGTAAGVLRVRTTYRVHTLGLA